MIHIVLGMHKSGTTLVSQILHHSGVDMGDFDESVSYDRGNKYERASVLALDMDILGAPDDEVLDLGVRGPLRLSEAQRVRMREIIADGQSRHADWGFKDPRLTLVYDLWARELPEHRLIAVYRDPAEAWPRFKWRGRRLYHTNFARASAFLDRWHEHNECLLRLAGEPGRNVLFLSYHELMSNDAELQRLRDFVGRDLVDRRQSGLYRGRPHPDVFLRAASWWRDRRTGRPAAAVLADLDAARR
ncbi:MAG: sulfotransferase [bacterium]|nr:sulfotransferase [bacterium]